MKRNCDDGRVDGNRNAGCRFLRVVIRHCSRCAAKTELCVTLISFEALVSFDSKVFTACPGSDQLIHSTDLAVDLCLASVIRYIGKSLHRKNLPNLDSRIAILGAAALLLRKEVIQPKVLLRLPCYDFISVTVNSLGCCFLAV